MSTFGDSTVSVCMPVYNGSEYIEDSIKSILLQTYTNFQLTVCDNCSTDNTEDIVRSFSDSRISYSCNEKNLGLVGNANRCLELADGDYVYILHHDDLMEPDNLQQKVRILDENPSVGFVHSNVGFINQYGEALNLTKFDANSNYIEKGITFFEQYMLRMPIGAAIFIGAVMARRECYTKLGHFNPKLPNVNDSEMWMRILLFYDVACISKRLVTYRLHDSMTSTAINDEEGLNIPGLKEHYLACRILLEQFPDRIPNRKELSIKMSTVFSMRAMGKGFTNFLKGDFEQSIPYLIAAFQFDPMIISRKPFWASMMSRIVRKGRP